MTTQEISLLSPGTIVYRVCEDASLKQYVLLGLNPIAKNICYFADFNHPINSESFFLTEYDVVWEVDYNKAKELVWKQLKLIVDLKNIAFFNGKKIFKFD
jgi:hypothetical protein